MRGGRLVVNYTGRNFKHATRTHGTHSGRLMEDIFMSVVGDEIRDRMNPHHQKYYSKPTVAGAMASIVIPMASIVIGTARHLYTESLRDSGVNVADVHTEQQAELIVRQQGLAKETDDIHWRRERIKRMNEKELKAYGEALKIGTHDNRTFLLSQVSEKD